MDPVSFAGSLVTLIAAVTASCKLMYSLRARFKDTPEDIERLIRQMVIFERLLQRIQSHLQDTAINNTAHGVLLTIWEAELSQMKRDADNLNGILQGSERLLSRKRTLKRDLILGARKILSQRTIRVDQNAFDTDFKSSRELNVLSQNEKKATTQAISAQAGSLDHISAVTRTAFADVSSQLEKSDSSSEAKYRLIQNCLDQQARTSHRYLQELIESHTKAKSMIETMLDRFSTGFPTDRREHQKTCVTISSLKRHLTPVVEKDISADPFTHSITTVVCDVRKHHWISCSFGQLEVYQTTSRQSSCLDPPSSEENTQLQLEVTFVPPLWLSWMAIRYTVSLDYQFTASQWDWGASRIQINASKDGLDETLLGLVSLFEYMPLIFNDLSPWQRWLVSLTAHHDHHFRSWLIKSLGMNCLSPSFVDHLGKDERTKSILDLRCLVDDFLKLTCVYQGDFMLFLGLSGSAPLVKLLVDANLHIDRMLLTGILESATYAGNVEIVDVCLSAGADGASALRYFLKNSEHLPDARFEYLLKTLVGSIRPISMPHADGAHCLVSLANSQRAMQIYPESLREGFSKFFQDVPHDRDDLDSDHELFHSVQKYSLVGILERGHVDFVDLLMQSGRTANRLVRGLTWPEGYDGDNPACTWLTLAVRFAQPSIVKLLLDNGGNVAVLAEDRASAVHLAILNARGLHPRRTQFWTGRYVFMRYATVEEDATTLALVEQAFNIKFKGKISMDEFVESFEPSQATQAIAAAPHQGTCEKLLSAFLAPMQMRRLQALPTILRRQFQDFWSLTFSQGIMIRFFYVLSYILLLPLVIHDMVKRGKGIPMPSRNTLSAVAVVVLAIYYSRILGMGW
ncbi:hypothetical protein ACLMJK_007614 [Lecanora helva]